MKKESSHAVVLHNVRSAHNVGSIFRTADAIGIQKVFLTGYTPAPFDKYARVNKEIAKTALGAEKSISWESKGSLKNVIAELKKDGYRIIGVEQYKKAMDYKKLNATKQLAFLFGSEVSGLSRVAIDMCDYVIEIPMRGRKESLNISVAAGVVLFQVLDKESSK